MLEKSQIISISSEVMGGTAVFTNTRVPIQTFIDYLKAGESLVPKVIEILPNLVL